MTKREREKEKNNNNTPQASTYRQTKREKKIIKKKGTPSVYHASTSSGFGRPKPSLATRR